MLKIVYLITLLTVGFSTLFIDGFRDILDRLPERDIDIESFPNIYYSLYDLQHENRERQVEFCAETCLKSGFFCNSFIVLETEIGIECRILPTLGSIFKHSQDNSNSVIAVYERESLPTTHELSQRFSISPSDQQVNYISEKYALPKKWKEGTQKFLETCLTALEKNLPVAVSITDWLRTGDLASSQLQHQSEFRKQLSRALESWQAWPRNPQAAIKSPDLPTLTFLDIFFRSLDEQIKTIYDPSEKTLIVEEPEKHLLIRSLGPGDYVLIFALREHLVGNNVVTFEQNKGESPLISLLWTTYGNERSNIDQETLDMFKGAMIRFHHEVSGEELDKLRQSILRDDSHTLSLKVVFDAVILMLYDSHHQLVDDGYEMLFQDLVTAVVSSVIKNEETQRIRSNLQGARGRLGFVPGGVDIDFITG